MTGVRRWPLVLIAAPAAVSIWSGWVGLGGLCGFGPVHPLPGIVPALRINTAITLPVGVEAYGAYALGAWLSLPAAHPARPFARRSAVGSLLLGMLGQVAYHVLAAAHAARAPWPVVVLVACLPVVTLGFGAALTHLLRTGPPPPAGTCPWPRPAPVLPAPAGNAPAPVLPVAPAVPALAPRLAPAALAAVPAPALVPAPAGRTRPAPAARTRTRTRHRTGRPAPDRVQGRVTDESAAAHFAAAVADGQVPSRRRIKAELHVGQDRAAQIHDYLTAAAGAAGQHPRRTA
jgi:hypothetical protein